MSFPFCAKLPDPFAFWQGVFVSLNAVAFSTG